MTRVWIHEYEYELATPPLEPFAVGDYVEWPVVPLDRNDWLERLFAGTRTTVDAIYGTQAAQTMSMSHRGLVLAIDEVYSEMMETPIDRLAVEVSIAEGGARRDAVKRVDWRPSQPDRDDVQFVGYLVTLDP